MSDAVPIGDSTLYRTVLFDSYDAYIRILDCSYSRRLVEHPFIVDPFTFRRGAQSPQVKEHCRVHTLPSYPSCYYIPHVPQSLPDHHLTDVAQSIPESSAATNAENEHVWQRLCHRGEAYTGSQAQKEWTLDNLTGPAEAEWERLDNALTDVNLLELNGQFRTRSGLGGTDNSGWEEHAARMDSGLASGPITQHSLTAAQATTAREPILDALEAFAARQYTILQALDTCPTQGTDCSRMASTPAGSLASFRGPSQAGPTSAAPTTTGQ